MPDARARARVRLYPRALKGFHRFVAGLDAAWCGLWLGMLSRDDLHAVDDAFYDELPMYRGDEHNRRGLFDWEAEAMDAHFPRQGALLVVGAG